MKRKRILWISFGLIFILLVLFVLKTLSDAGFFFTPKPHFKGEANTVKIPDNAGTEDITIDFQTGWVFISIDDRRTNRFWDKGISKTSKQGGIYGFNIKKEKFELSNFTSDFKQDFHPHGIGKFVTKEGKILIFAVNHFQNYQKHSIEIFEFQENKLKHLRTIQDSLLLTSPNDVVAVSENTFYVTNDHYFTDGLMKMMEDYLRFPYSYVNYFDGNKMTKIASNIIYANGINCSEDRKKIFVASTTGRKILVYDRNIPDGKLKLSESIFVGTGLDNIELDEVGNLWTACHPKMLDFVQHAFDSTKSSPSQVLRISPKGNDWQIEEVYLNEGKPFSGSSVAAVFGNHLLIGAVFEPSFLWCKMKK